MRMVEDRATDTHQTAAFSFSLFGGGVNEMGGEIRKCGIYFLVYISTNLLSISVR